jgi:ADP-ribose pyrophosphatase YjhB (NUDIX family)
MDLNDLICDSNKNLKKINTKSRINHPVYLKDNFKRYDFDEKYLSWDINYPEYAFHVRTKHIYTTQSVFYSAIDTNSDYTFTKTNWSDTGIDNIVNIKDHRWKYFNENNRQSIEKLFLQNGRYLIDGINNTFMKSGIKGAPLFPGGRTGACGRGLLGKWGPNFAADPIITFYYPNTDKLCMIGIIRKDTGELAIPGGMVDPGEKAKTAALREIFEEALGESDELGNLQNIFDKEAYELYSGIVDDPRTTDNAWIETSVYHLHINDNELIYSIESKLVGNDDATKAEIVEIEPIPELYANHANYIELAINRVNNLNNLNNIKTKKEE